MEKLLNQFKALSDDEKLAFMKEAMPYPPSQKSTGLPVDECANNCCATA